MENKTSKKHEKQQQKPQAAERWANQSTVQWLILDNSTGNLFSADLVTSYVDAVL